MEPDSLSFLTLITKRRVIPCSAFGVRRSAFGVLGRSAKYPSCLQLVQQEDTSCYCLTSVFGYRYLQKFHVKKKKEKTNFKVIQQLTLRISE